MRTSRNIMMVAALLAAMVFAGCGPKKLSGPPQALLDEMASVEAAYAALAPQSPSAEDSAKYTAAMQAAKDALAASNYELAAQKTKLARLEVARLGAALNFRQLELLGPDPTLTYHYRQQIKLSEDAQAAGKMDEAITAAEEAGRQARLAVELVQQCVDEQAAKLASIRQEIEKLYRPELLIIQLYWKAMAAIPAHNCDQARQVTAELAERVKRFQDTTVGSNATFTISAPPEFVRIYGDPIMFGEVTPEGLKTRLARVAVGTKVNFVRANLAAPGKTYYYVEDPNSGFKGWMAEERVWPERAAQWKAQP